ncbi:MAG: dihydropyrimidinase [Chloroflexi bacterium]|nr:dihydropyrimidinase [Chloroflexota bacterium]
MREIRLIKGGTVVTAGETYQADVAIDGGRIVALGHSLDAPAGATIDARGAYVIPGGIDVHTHLDTFFGGTTSCDNYRSGTVAAAAGGTTSIIDYGLQAKGQRLTEVAESWVAKGKGNSVIDWGIHVMIGEMNDGVLADIGTLVEQGITSFKVFLAYKGAVMIDDWTLFRTLLRAKEVGALVMAHCENGDVLDVLVRQALAAGQTEPKYHASTRPEEAEAEATNRFLTLAGLAGVPAYVVHLSCAPALEEVRRAQARGQMVWAETCPQYLFTSQEDIEKPGFEGAKYVFSPPPRDKRNWEAIWSGLASGALATVASDHCPFRFADQKTLGSDNFSKIPNGGPGIEDRVGLLYHYGAVNGRLTLNRWVDVCSTQAAKIFGMFPRKGAIVVGADADLVVWDPKTERTLSAVTQKSAIDYHLYEGFKISGQARDVLVRGATVFENGEFVGEYGHGQFVKRNKVLS